MRDGLVRATAMIEDCGYTLDQIRDYLDDIRDTGRINMYGASDYLMNVWGFTRQECRPIIADYLRHGLLEEIEDTHLYGQKYLKE